MEVAGERITWISEMCNIFATVVSGRLLGENLSQPTAAPKQCIAQKRLQTIAPTGFNSLES